MFKSVRRTTGSAALPALREIAARPTTVAPGTICPPSPSFPSNPVMTAASRVIVRQRSLILRVTAIVIGNEIKTVITIGVSEGGTTKMSHKITGEGTMTAAPAASLTLVTGATMTGEAGDTLVGATGEAMVIDIGRNMGGRMRNVCAVVMCRDLFVLGASWPLSAVADRLQSILQIPVTMLHASEHRHLKRAPPLSGLATSGQTADLICSCNLYFVSCTLVVAYLGGLAPILSLS